MMEVDFDRFAGEWIAAWNAHDLEAIVSHYAQDVVYYSPLLATLVGPEEATLRGRDAVRDYFARGLEAYPDLRFELKRVLVGTDSCVLLYRSIESRLSAELLVLDGAGKVREVRAHYAEPAAPA
jgi:hypothetical protein